jgi:hypothetical protein
VRLSVGCPAEMGHTCAVRVRLRAGRVQLRSGRARIRPGRVGSVRVRLTSEGQRLIRASAGKDLVGSFSLRARLRGGRSGLVRGPLTLPVDPL